MIFKDFLKTSGYSKNTINQYMLYYNKIKGNRISQKSIDEFCRRYNHAVFRAFLKLYLYEFKKKKNINIIKLRGRKKERLPKFLEMKEVELLYKEAQNQGKEDLMFVILLGSYSGLRISEILSLTPVNIKSGTIKGKGDKEGVIFIKDNIKKTLNRYVKKYDIDPTEKLFNTTRFSVDTRLRRLSKKVLGKPVSAHQFRHTCAMYLLDKGMSIEVIKEFLRQKNLSSTEIYARVRKTRVKKIWKEIVESKKIRL